ncbi:MAG: Co(2+)/Mg(2+) efflux protein ApaG [Verrucomicrobiota bacterium]
MQSSGKELPGLRVTVDRVVHQTLPDHPSETPHAFAYFLTILNLSTETVRIIGRKWVLRAGDGSVQVVEGDGVVGKSPLLAPGEKFSYSSHHLSAGPVRAEGAFHGVTGHGERVFVRIPPFEMTPPSPAT